MRQQNIFMSFPTGRETQSRLPRKEAGRNARCKSQRSAA